MKNMWESAETFTAYATIEYCYYMISEIFNSIPNRSGIERAIDKVTGYDKFLDKGLAEKLVPLVEEVIAAKKIIEADYSKDFELLNKSREVLNSEQKDAECDANTPNSSN